MASPAGVLEGAEIPAVVKPLGESAYAIDILAASVVGGILAFIGMLEGRNFGKLIVRVARGPRRPCPPVPQSQAPKHQQALAIKATAANL
ncbi:MAG: hypothetical protein ACRD36_09085 [Candidatus Acidiferrum sp.]